MKDHRMPFLGIGAASIVLVLTIVSLSVFATLTISSANGDYTLSQKNLERTTNYYKASNEVNCTLSQIDKKLWKNYHKTKNKKSYMKNISKSLVDLKGITYDKTKHTIQFQKSITSKQQINVKIRICYPEKQRNHCYEILCFKNEAVGTWKKMIKGDKMNIEEFLTLAAEKEASDLFIIAGLPLTMKTNGVMHRINEERMMPQDTEEMIREIYKMAADRNIDKLLKTGDDDFSFAIPGLSRFRVSAYKQRGSLAAVIRVIAFRLPDSKEIGIPDQVMRLSELNKGLVLVTGSAGSGKSTTLACMVEEINETKEDHIITLEDPLEFLHQHKKSIVSQREVNMDTVNYVTSLRAALRQSPDVILLGEMRDYETIQVVMTAAETGHLVFSTLHTIGAANTIERIIDVFPPNQQRQITIQLASVLQAVISQQLIPSVDGTLIPVFEIMEVTPAIRNMIRENKVHQIDGLIYSSTGSGMMSMDQSLMQAYRDGKITKETAVLYALNAEMLSKRLR